MKDADTPALGPVRALLPLGIGGAVVAWMVRDAVVQEGGWTTLEGALTVTGWPVALMAVLFFASQVANLRLPRHLTMCAAVLYLVQAVASAMAFAPSLSGDPRRQASSWRANPPRASGVAAAAKCGGRGKSGTRGLG